MGVPSYLVSKSWQPSVVAQASTGIPGFLDLSPGALLAVRGFWAAWPLSGEPPDTSLVHLSSGLAPDYPLRVEFINNGNV